MTESRAWLFDLGHRAVQQWVKGWRATNATAPLPSLRFADHLGDHARGMTRGLHGRDSAVVLARFASAGYQGVCVCGRDVLDWPDDGVAQPVDKGVALSQTVDLPKWMLEAYQVKRRG